MKDLSRLLESSDDELLLSLLRSANEEPPAESLGRVAAALGVGSAFTGASATAALLTAKAHATSLPAVAASVGTEAAASSTPMLLALIVKPLAIGLLGGLAAAGGVSYVSAPSAPPREHAVLRKSPHDSAHSPLVAKRVANASTGSVSESSERVEPLPVHAPVVAAQSSARAVARSYHRSTSANEPPAPAPELVSVPRASAAAFSVAAPAAAPEHPAAREEALAKELAILGRARRLLVSGDGAGALRTLDQYAAERQSGALEPEAATLRIQALERTGDHGGASRLARAFLKAHPERSHDDSLRSIAGEAR
jgi:hypothetical protein